MQQSIRAMNDYDHPIDKVFVSRLPCGISKFLFLYSSHFSFLFYPTINNWQMQIFRRRFWSFLSSLMMFFFRGHVIVYIEISNTKVKWGLKLIAFLDRCFLAHMPALWERLIFDFIIHWCFILNITWLNSVRLLNFLRKFIVFSDANCWMSRNYKQSWDSWNHWL